MIFLDTLPKFFYIYILIISFIFAYNVKKIFKNKGKGKKEIIILCLIILTTGINSFVFHNFYNVKINSSNVNISEIEICLDKCIIINPNDLEKSIVEYQLSKYTFKYDNNKINYGYFEDDNSPAKRMTVDVNINNEKFIFSYINKFSLNNKGLEESYVLYYIKDGVNYSKTGRNPVSEIIKKYVELHKDVLKGS